MKMKAAALVPAYNEAKTIAEVVRGVRPFVSQVLVVDDGSTDSTGDEARGAGASVIAHPANQGKGHAVRTGLAHLLGDDFTHVILMDGDMQHLPDETPRLLEAARATDADVVIGERCFDPAGMPASRYHANRIGSRALSWFVGVPVATLNVAFASFAPKRFAECVSPRAAMRSKRKCSSNCGGSAGASPPCPSRPYTTDSGVSCGPSATPRAPVS